MLSVKTLSTYALRFHRCVMLNGISDIRGWHVRANNTRVKSLTCIAFKTLSQWKKIHSLFAQLTTFNTSFKEKNRVHCSQVLVFESLEWLFEMNFSPFSHSMLRIHVELCCLSWPHLPIRLFLVFRYLLPTLPLSWSFQSRLFSGLLHSHSLFSSALSMSTVLNK